MVCGPETSDKWGGFGGGVWYTKDITPPTSGLVSQVRPSGERLGLDSLGGHWNVGTTNQIAVFGKLLV